MHTDDRKRGVGENLLSANSCVQACVCAGNYIFPLECLALDRDSGQSQSQTRELAGNVECKCSWDAEW